MRPPAKARRCVPVDRPHLKTHDETDGNLTAGWRSPTEKTLARRGARLEPAALSCSESVARRFLMDIEMQDATIVAASTRRPLVEVRAIPACATNVHRSSCRRPRVGLILSWSAVGRASRARPNALFRSCWFGTADETNHERRTATPTTARVPPAFPVSGPKSKLHWAQPRSPLMLA